MPKNHSRWRLAGVGLLAAVLTNGCATATVPLPAKSLEDAAPALQLETPEFIPVVRYGRYTLVELAPTTAQRDLLAQSIDVSIPEEARATVGDGLQHVLRRSGYTLCQTADAVIDLYALPLPAAHLHLGPMTLRDALLALVGPAWELQVDERTRQICFKQSGDRVAAELASAPISSAAQARPLVSSMAGGQP